MWTSARRLLLASGDREIVEGLVRGRNTAQKVALRARIILGAAQGISNNRLAQQLGVTRLTILLWRQRYAQAGVVGLLRDAPRPGRRKRIGARQVEAIVNATLHTTPREATHWSSRTLARAQGVSEATVRRIWRAHGLQPHRTETFKLSRDPDFVHKLRDVVGLYLHPPDKALVLCVDEKGQIQALDRTAPILPLRPGLPERQTHDYKRHGTTTLFAAFNILNGKVIGTCLPRHRGTEFLKFLTHLEQEVPQDVELHLILDNYSTHKSAAVQRWLKPAKRRRFHFHFTPTSSSWLNQVERWFGLITEKMIRRGTFHSVDELERAIYAWLATWNDAPKPFVWHAPADVILEKVRRCKELNGTPH